MGDLKPTSQFAVRHLSSCDWPSFEPRLGMFRGEVRHVSGCERPCFAMRKVNFGVLSELSKLYGVSGQVVTKLA